MPYYRYKAKDKTGTTLSGLIQSISSDLAVDMLSEQGLVILSLKEEDIKSWDRSLKFFNRIKIKDLVVFSRQLSVIISATIPLVQGLRIIVNQTENPAFQAIISEVADDVEGGAKLSVSLGRHPHAFSDFFVNIIKSGETSGKLDEVLNYLADQQEKDYDLSSKIKGAMIYPIFILAGLVTVGALMMIFVIPQLTSILAETGVQLPLSTRILISVSNFLAAYWWAVLIALIFGISSVRVLISTPKGRYYWDTFKLRLPIFGKLFQKIILVRLTRSLCTLITGGVSLTKSLDIVSNVVGNETYKIILRETRLEVEDGNSIATIFLKRKEVPVMVSQMLKLGEKTGRIDEILDKLANFYSREVNNMVANLTTIIEPLIMVLMGAAVGILVAAIILPMYNLAAVL